MYTYSTWCLAIFYLSASFFACNRISTNTNIVPRGRELSSQACNFVPSLERYGSTWIHGISQDLGGNTTVMSSTPWWKLSQFRWPDFHLVSMTQPGGEKEALVVQAPGDGIGFLSGGNPPGATETVMQWESAWYSAWGVSAVWCSLLRHQTCTLGLKIR